MTDRFAVVVPLFNEPDVARTLEALRSQKDAGDFRIYIVDNGSTDDSVHRVEHFARLHPEVRIDVVEELQKGTGAACDTGFRRAMADGATVVARTDSDSEPAEDWLDRIRTAFENDPRVQLLGGTSIPLRDRYFRPGDELILPLALGALRIILAVCHLDAGYLRFVAGHNMAVRASSYAHTGGFARTSIDTRDEDIDFSVRVVSQLGLSAVRIDSRLRVATSMRRVRKYGLGMMGLHHMVPQLRGKIGKVIDVR
ncbi:glycosyltransferase involved in cell wall biosynthesis [Arthrobacter sp. CAN_A214]|uniref:glycosyltransferase n=1 Tax=Arthrobacter sp. CAN_A214 TaxID=2787720 RepID=UPI0018CA6AEB